MSATIFVFSPSPQLARMSTKSRSLDAVDEKVEASTSASEVPAETLYRPEIDTSGVDERKLLRRIDWHVVPWLAVLYLLNFLDRGNIGNARVSRCSLTGGGPRNTISPHERLCSSSTICKPI